MGTRHFTVAGLSAAVLALALVTGCGQGSGTPSAGGSAAASPSRSIDSGTSAALSQSPAASSSAPAGGSAPGGGSNGGTPAAGSNARTPSAGELTVSGQVEAGAEPTCLILRSNDSTYELLSGDRNVVKAGNTVTVTGHVVTGVMSHCMQGKMFQVIQARLG